MALNLVILHTEDILTSDTYSNVQIAVNKALPDFQVLILEHGIEITLIKDNQVIVDTKTGPIHEIDDL